MSEEIKTFLIFGGAGFLGKYVIEKLARTHARICVVSRHAPHASYLKTAGSPGQIITIAGDITHEATLKKLFTASSFDAVINLTGILYEKNTQRFSKIHEEGAVTLAKYAAESGSKHFIHVSALGIDKTKDSLYAKSKLAAEKKILEQFFPHAVILRPSVMFGEEDKFFNVFASMARFAPCLPLIGGGKTLFQPVYVDDVAKAIMYALYSRESKGKIFELGGPDVVSFKEIMAYILQQIKRVRVLLPIPFGLAQYMAFFAEYLPHPPLTRDQLALLKIDNIVSKGANTFANMHIEPTAFHNIVPHYLKRYNRI